jgi:hypothetical protein
LHLVPHAKRPAKIDSDACQNGHGKHQKAEQDDDAAAIVAAESLQKTH